ncbi:MAG: hypothetical protein J7621_02825 [Niastella sp.]|nr:hypothetical protein [Niastella sp.]
MQKSAIEHLVTLLAKELLTDSESFESMAREYANNLSTDDFSMLQIILHNPPTVHPDIQQDKPGLGGWLAACQYAVFELLYCMDEKALSFLKSTAYGKYDWTQATALEVMCRLYVDGKVSADVITEIDHRLNGMRHETHLYLAQGLLNRKKKDERYHGVITQITSVDFRLALSELGALPRLTRDELIAIGKRIMKSDGNEEEINKLQELFDRNVPHPTGSGLFYWPENYHHDKDDITEYNPTVEEIVDKCLSYKPIIL